MTKDLFNSMMNFFKSSKGTLITDERILSYWAVLKDYPDEHTKRVTFNCVKKHDFFPTISQVVREFEVCQEEEVRNGSYVKKIEAPRHVKRDRKWIRQTRVLLSCKGNQNKNHFKLYTDGEIEKITKDEGGDKRLLKFQEDGFAVDMITGEVNGKQGGEIICQEQK